MCPEFIDFIVLISRVIMSIQLMGALVLFALLLRFRKRMPGLFGVQWCIFFLLLMPLCSVGIDLLSNASLTAPYFTGPLALPTRRISSYGLTAVALWGFIVWIVRTPRVSKS